MAKYWGFNAPFLGGNQKVLSRQVDDKLIRNDILQLLLTAPGERVMRPDFGSEVRNHLFGQMDETSKSTLISSIRNAMEKYEGRVQVTDINVEYDNVNNRTDIKVYGFFRLDRFRVAGSLEDADLLVELKVNTSKSNQLR